MGSLPLQVRPVQPSRGLESFCCCCAAGTVDAYALQCRLLDYAMLVLATRLSQKTLASFFWAVPATLQPLQLTLGRRCASQDIIEEPVDDDVLPLAQRCTPVRTAERPTLPEQPLTFVG